MNTLHYIFDPFCGWCYAAAPLLRAAQGVAGLDLALHGGGMLAGARRRAITPQWRDYVMPHDQRIAALTGQPFGAAYFDGLLRDTAAVMDSAPPTTAILAAEAVAGRGLDMLHALQHAHYVAGRRIAEPAVLEAIAAGLGLPAQAFAAAFGRLAGAATEAHIDESLAWLSRSGGQGFPTFAFEDARGHLTRLDTGAFLGQPEAFAAALRERLPAAAGGPAAAQCGLTGCVPPGD
ncbi:MAG: DsbA family protein [Candidatus Dactylopiibacterium sp.]|nr:DsbA family protein [Candidatus Dactylopiibacterium sp.]